MSQTLEEVLSELIYARSEIKELRSHIEDLAVEIEDLEADLRDKEEKLASSASEPGTAQFHAWRLVLALESGLGHETVDDSLDVFRLRRVMGDFKRVAGNRPATQYLPAADLMKDV